MFKNSGKFTKNNNLIRRKKFFYKKYSLNLNFKNLNLFSIITKNIHYDFKPYKMFIGCETLGNFKLTIPGISGVNVGKILLHYSLFKNHMRSFCATGLIVPLYMVGITTIFSNISNKYNTKLTYSKASGTFSKLKKAKKTKKKLLLVVLPSKSEIFLTKYSKVYIGKNKDFRLNSLVEGKWGFSFHKFKKIAVRGVAMNPVDHPNGGRAKTVQPERSPWNWVAKKKK